MSDKDLLNDDLEINGTITANKFNGNGVDLQTLLFKRNIPLVHTGVTGETVILTQLIPAGTFEANDIFKFFLAYTMTNNANGKEVRCYINSTPNLTGTPIRCGTRSTVSVASNSLGREIIFRNSLTTQNVMSANVNNQTPEATIGLGFQNVNADFTIDQYFILSFNVAVGTDQLTLQYLWAKILR